MKIPAFSLEKQETRILLVVLALFLAVYFLNFPSFYASTDEHEYIRNSLLIQKGTLIEKDITQMPFGVLKVGKMISQYFIGRSLFLIPFTWAGFEAIMLSGMVIHILNFFIFFKILGRMRLRRIYSLFYLLYPAFFWEARTLNSEILILTGIFLGIFFYLSDKRSEQMLSGLFFGLAVLPRYEAIILSGVFLLVPLVRDRRKFLNMLAGFVPVMIFILWFNATFYGAAMATGYGTNSVYQFLHDIGTGEIFWSTMGRYLLILSLAYPLMLISPFFKSRLRLESVLALVVYIVFYSENSFIADLSLSPATLVTAQLRYVIPLLGVMMIVYIPFYERVISKLRLPKSATTCAVIAVLFIVYVSASGIHANFLDGREFVFNAIYENTETGSLLIGSSDDSNYALNSVFDERHYLDAKTEGLEDYIEKFENVYVLDIRYSTTDYSGTRGSLIIKERGGVKKFIEQNHDHLELIVDKTTPNSIKIYRYK